MELSSEASRSIESFETATSCVVTSGNKLGNEGARENELDAQESVEQTGNRCAS